MTDVKREGPVSFTIGNKVGGKRDKDIEAHDPWCVIRSGGPCTCREAGKVNGAGYVNVSGGAVIDCEVPVTASDPIVQRWMEMTQKIEQDYAAKEKSFGGCCDECATWHLNHGGFNEPTPSTCVHVQDGSRRPAAGTASKPSTAQTFTASEVREFLGYLTTVIPALHDVEIPLIADAFENWQRIRVEAVARVRRTRSNAADILAHCADTLKRDGATDAEVLAVFAARTAIVMAGAVQSFERVRVVETGERTGLQKEIERDAEKG